MSYPSREQIEKAQNQYLYKAIEHWIHVDLFTLRWWILVMMLIAPWFVWWKLIDRKRINEIIIIGFITSIVSILIDTIGWSFNRWWYPNSIILALPFNIVADLTMLPIINMMLYQYFRRWGFYLRASLVKALIFAFVAEPLLAKLNVYDPHHWKHIYSFPFYIALDCFYKWLTDKIVSKSSIRVN